MPDRTTKEEAKIFMRELREQKLSQIEITDYILSRVIEKLKTIPDYVGTFESPSGTRETITINYYKLYSDRKKIVDELRHIMDTKLQRKEINEDDSYNAHKGLITIFEVSQYMIGAVELIPEEDIDYILDELFETYKRFSLNTSYYTDVFTRVFGRHTMEWNRALAIMYLASVTYKLFAIEFIKLYTGYE